MKNKKKLLFCIENLRHGGISKGIESLISAIDHDRYEINIFCINRTDGPYKESLKAHLTYKQNRILYYLSTFHKEHSGVEKYLLLFFKAFNKVLKKITKFDLFEYNLKHEAKNIIKENYDVVIAYSEGIITKFVSKIEAKKKIAWVHIDYKRYLEYCGEVKELNIYKAYDNIVTPSVFSKKSFVEVFPSLKNRVVAIPNLLNITDIIKKANTPSPITKSLGSNEFTILSIGRICHEKGFVKIPKIVNDLIKRGNNLKWYIIGEGSKNETEYLKNEIEKENVKNFVILIGAKDNPYPYIKNSDLVAVTSISETFCYVIGEAKIIGTPIIATNFGTVREVLDNQHGVISDINCFADTLHNIMNDKNLYSKLRRNIKTYKHNNNIVLEQLYSIFNK